MDRVIRPGRGLWQRGVVSGPPDFVAAPIVRGRGANNISSRRFGWDPLLGECSVLLFEDAHQDLVVEFAAVEGRSAPYALFDEPSFFVGTDTSGVECPSSTHSHQVHDAITRKATAASES